MNDNAKILESVMVRQVCAAHEFLVEDVEVTYEDHLKCARTATNAYEAIFGKKTLMVYPARQPTDTEPPSSPA